MLLTFNIEHSTFNVITAMVADYTFDLEHRLLSFSARIIRFTESFPSTCAANHIAQQLLRSGTSSLASHGEAQAAESPADFIHKLRICLKELRETRRWLLLARVTVFDHAPQRVDPLLLETEELIKIFVASTATAQRNKLKQSHSRSSKTIQSTVMPNSASLFAAKSASYKLRHLMFNVRCSMFDVQCPMFNVRC